MIIIDICYTTCILSNQTVAPALPGFQGLKICIQYMDIHPHKPIFILIILMMAQIPPDLHGVGIKWKNTQPIMVWNFAKMQIMLELLT